MAVDKYPVHAQWLAQILVPYLRHAFKHVLRYNADITPSIRNAIDFCMVKPDYPTDGDDLVFERVMFAIENRRDGLPTELRTVTDNIEALAKFLIRRAQVKGPYELLGRDMRSSEAWKQYESGRLLGLQSQGVTQRLAVQEEKRTIPEPLAATRALSPFKAQIKEDLIDPRLIYALPGQYTSPEISGSMTTAEDQYHRNQNRTLAEYRARMAANDSWDRQLLTAAQPALLQQQQQQPQHVSMPPLRDTQCDVQPKHQWGKEQLPSFKQDLSRCKPSVYTGRDTSGLPDTSRHTPCQQGAQAPSVQQASVPTAYMYPPMASSTQPSPQAMQVPYHHQAQHDEPQRQYIHYEHPRHPQHQYSQHHHHHQYQHPQHQNPASYASVPPAPAAVPPPINDHSNLHLPTLAQAPGKKPSFTLPISTI